MCTKNRMMEFRETEELRISTLFIHDLMNWNVPIGDDYLNKETTKVNFSTVTKSHLAFMFKTNEWIFHFVILI